MHLTHLIIDDFFNDPLTIRKAALNQTFPDRPEKAIYPGRNADKPLQFDGLDQLVSQIVHEPVKATPKYSYGVPRIALEGDVAKQNIHVDFTYWSAVVFLTLDEHCQGGTHFFRHKPTGWDRAPVFPGEAERAGFVNADAAVKSILDKDANNPDAWEKTMTLPMKFNRIVIFRGYMWHDAGISFGKTPEEGRLILPFFFENTHRG